MSFSTATSVGIFVFDDVEVLDFAGPFEVFTTASRVNQRYHPQAANRFEVSCISRDGLGIRTRAGLRVLPERSFASHGTIDLLLIPGGVVDATLNCPQTLDWIARTAQQAKITASVCTGAFLLAASGVLRSGRVTTHWEDLADLQSRYPSLTVSDGQRWIDNGELITSAGISAGIDMSLHLVSRLAGKALAQRTARQMDYPWVEDDTGV